MEVHILILCLAASVCVFSSSSTVRTCHGQRALNQNFITWDDLNVKRSYSSSDEVNDVAGNGRVIVVSFDGSGDSTTVQGAVDMVADGNLKRVKIMINTGVYREKVTVPATKPFISFIGTGSSQPVISWNSTASDRDSNGQEVGTYNSSTVAIESDYFAANGITFENTSPAPKPGEEGKQAVALRLTGDRAVLYRCDILGSQDTLYDHLGRHYFLECFIQGSIDFIFGIGRSLYQNCTLNSIAESYGAIAASQRDSESEETGFSFLGCTVNGTGMIYLGRAWGRYARVIYSNCIMDGIIIPKGWNDWGDPSRTSTVWFGEYKCRGQGADTRRRVDWAKSLAYAEARPFLNQGYIEGEKWLRL